MARNVRPTKESNESAYPPASALHHVHWITKVSRSLNIYRHILYTSIQRNRILKFWQILWSLVLVVLWCPPILWFMSVVCVLGISLKLFFVEIVDLDQNEWALNILHSYLLLSLSLHFVPVSSLARSFSDFSTSQRVRK